MREVNVDLITQTIERLCIEANYYLPADVKKALEEAVARKNRPWAGKSSGYNKECQIAQREDMPIARDTGLAVIFLELGQDVHLVGGDLNEAINEGVRRGYINGYLRKSSVDDPFLVRKNTGDNTPAIVHTTIVPGDKIKIIVAPKGGGSENMSALAMLKPADGVEVLRSLSSIQ